MSVAVPHKSEKDQIHTDVLCYGGDSDLRSPNDNESVHSNTTIPSRKSLQIVQQGKTSSKLCYEWLIMFPHRAISLFFSHSVCVHKVFAPLAHI
jgi:hypothetical protein